MKQIIHFALYLALLAGLAAAGWRFMVAQRPVSASVERHRISSIYLNAVPAFQAFRTVQETSGVKINVRWNDLARTGMSADTKVFLDFQDVTVDQVVDALSKQLRGWYTGAVDYEVHGDTIVVGSQESLRKIVRIYEIDDLLQEPAATAPLDKIIHAIQCYLEPRCPGYSNFLMNEEVCLAGSSQLVVLQTPVTHERLGRFFQGLRNARPDGSGPSIQRGHVYGYERDSFLTTLRFYDVRDLVDRAECTVLAELAPDGHVWKKARTLRGVAALVWTLQCVARRLPWKYHDLNDTVYAACGRIMVEQTDQNQDEVREFFRDVRSGELQPIWGLRMRPTGE
jgi:hypothetical protein